MVKNIAEKLRESKLYEESVLDKVMKLQPSSAFFTTVGNLYMTFAKDLSQDKLLQEFYGKMYSDWKDLFPSCNDPKIMFLMLIHLPEKLVNFYKHATANSRPKEVHQSLLARERGPLTYIAGYVIHAMYKKSKNSKHWQSNRSQELQALLVSLKDDSASEEFVSSLSRGGLWTPNSTVVGLCEQAELSFRRHTSVGGERSIPADKILCEVLGSPTTISLWESAMMNSSVEISQECQNLCLENILKLYIRVRCFSHAKDIVNKYKLKEKLNKNKALRTDLKRK